MIEVDVIIPSNAKTDKLRLMTEYCVETLLASEKNIRFNLFLFEQSQVGYSFPYYRYSTDVFNYHRIMNYGISLGKAPYVCLCNNDLEFTRGWATELLKYADQYPSMSPRDRKAHPSHKFRKAVYEGYNIGFHITGWCIFVRRDVFDIIGGLDESVDFWYSDNLYAEQLKAAGIKHALITKSLVNHLNGGSNTLKTNGLSKILDLTQKQKTKYDNAKREKYSALDTETL